MQTLLWMALLASLAWLTWRDCRMHRSLAELKEKCSRAEAVVERYKEMTWPEMSNGPWHMRNEPEKQ